MPVPTATQEGKTLLMLTLMETLESEVSKSTPTEIQKGETSWPIPTEIQESEASWLTSTEAQEGEVPLLPTTTETLSSQLFLFVGRQSIMANPHGDTRGRV